MALYNIPPEILLEDIGKHFPTFQKIGGAIKKSVVGPSEEETSRKKHTADRTSYHQWQLKKLNHKGYYDNMNNADRQSRIARSTGALNSLKTTGVESVEEDNIILDEDMKEYHLGSANGERY